MLDYQTVKNRPDLLVKFEELVESLAPIYPVKKLDKYVYTIGREKDDEKIHFTFMAIVHGNEPSGLFILLKFLKCLKRFQPKLSFSIAVALGNYKAFLKDKRFLETDLNRSFSSPEVNSWEQKRAVDLSVLLDQTEYLIDFHQTLQPSVYPFFIFPYTSHGIALTAHLTKNIPMITHWGKKFSLDGMCTDEYVNNRGGIGITIETGFSGIDPLQVSFGLSLLLKVLSFTAPLEKSFLSKLFKNLNKEDLSLYTWNQVFPYPSEEHEVFLKKGLKNFASITKGEHLGNYSDKDIIAEVSGLLLFPKYVKKEDKRPKELFRLAKKISFQDLP